MISFVNVSTQKPFSVLNMFMQTDTFVQIIMLLLLAMSIYSWSIAFEKIILLKSITKEYSLFDKLLQDNDYNISVIEHKYSNLIKKLNIFRKIIFAIYDSICATKGYNKKIDKNDLFQDIELKIQKINDKIENKLYILRSISSSAPFIGLLGVGE